MSTSPNRQYVDHPAPSVFLIVLLFATLAALLAVVPYTAGPAWAVMAVAAGAIGFYFWPFYTTYYTVSEAGLGVRYGPWNRRYPWSDFVTAYWQKGLFATRIGWPSITPCVRLTNGVLLKRRTKWFGLYLTPNDPKAFLHRVSEFAPQLTSEMIL